jgi:hypothetical protein
MTGDEIFRGAEGVGLEPQAAAEVVVEMLRRCLRVLEGVTEGIQGLAIALHAQDPRMQGAHVFRLGVMNGSVSSAAGALGAVETQLKQCMASNCFNGGSHQGPKGPLS